MIRRGHDWQSRHLCHGHCAVLYGVARAAGAVGRDAEMVAALAPSLEFEHRRRAATAARSAQGLDAKTFENRRKKRAIAARADECGDSGLGTTFAAKGKIHFDAES